MKDEECESVYIACDVTQGPLSADVTQFLLVADKTLENIYHVDPHDASGTTRHLLPYQATKTTLAVAYSPTKQAVFWTEYDELSLFIRKYSFIDQSTKTIYIRFEAKTLWIGSR